VAPVVLNTFEMPLINDHNNFLSLALINLLEKILITLVDKNLLQSGEEDVCTLSVPVDKMLIKAFLGEGLRVCLSDLLTVGTELLSVEALCVLETLEEVVWYVHAGLVIKTVSSLAVQFVTQELDLSSNLLSCLTSILDLKTGEPEFKVKAKAEVELEGGPVECPSG
jgi:hypothetical protein